MKHIKYILIFFIFTACEKTDLGNYAQTLYVSYKGADMPVYLHGNAASKKIILLVHGGPGGSGLEYRFGSWKNELEEKYLMAYWDQRGQGQSQGKYTDAEISVAQMADDLYTVVRTLKIKFGNDTQVVLLGHSWGGTLGTKYMVNETYQAEVAGWIEADGAHDIPLLNQEAIKLFRKVSDEQIGLGNSIDDWQTIKDWAEGVNINNITDEDGGSINENGFSVESYLQNDGFISNIYETSWADLKLTLFSPQNIATSYFSGNYTANAVYEDVESTSLTNQLHKITKPCLFLWGKYDFVVPAALGYDAFQKVTSSQKKLVVFEKSGHSPMNSEPVLFTNAIVEFMDSL